MTAVSFLPVLQRELRVASRRQMSYWSRVMAAGVALFVASGVMAMASAMPGGFGPSPGSIVFSVLKALSFVFVSLAGIFLTSDCLSEEKREGTMGLLFLTDLRGYDVVLGKLGASSVRAVYGLLAAFPILALGFLMGGVTGSEFWRLTLVLCNTLFVSLALGMFISSISRDAQKAMIGTLLLGAVLFFVPWGLDWWWADWTSTNYVARFGIASPLWTLLQTNGRTTQFWHGLGLTHGLGWLVLGLASVVSARSWQEKALAPEAARGASTSVPTRSSSKRERLLAVNPVLWLAGKRHWLASVSRWLILFCVVVFLALSVAYPAARPVIAHFLPFLGGLVMVLAVASQASSFFVDAKRTGMLELMLVTPLTVREIIGGQAWALRRMFLFPVLALVSMMAVAGILQLIQVYTAVSGMASPPSGAFGGFDYYAMQIISLARGLIGFLTGLLAVAWFGMWMGLTTSKTHVALIKTVVFVQVLPWFALVFVQPFSMILLRQANIMWISTVVTGLVALGLDIAFIVLSYRKVHRHLREWAGREGGSGGRQGGGVRRQESGGRKQ